MLRLYLAPALIGANPLDLEGAHRLMNKAIAGSFSTGMPITKAGLDLALHDLTGKARRQESARTVGAQTARPHHAELDGEREGDRRGRAADGGGPQARASEFQYQGSVPTRQFDLALAREVRRLAPDGFLWADANGGYDMSAA